MNPEGYKEGETGTMLRLLGAAQKREVKATQNLARIVIFFIICWFPLYTINCVMAFCPQCHVNDVFLNFCIILSHLNSVGNPMLYAYHLKDFRVALKNFICRLLLYPKSDIKPSFISVVPERGQLMCNDNSNGYFASKSRHTRHARQASEAVSKTKTTCLKNSSFLKYKEQNKFHNTSLKKTNNQNKSHDHIDEYVSPNISIGKSRIRQNDESSLESYESELESPSSRCSEIELRTYKSFLRFFDSDIESFDENIPESILVFEVDVNQITSSHEKLPD